MRATLKREAGQAITTKRAHTSMSCSQGTNGTLRQSTQPQLLARTVVLVAVLGALAEEALELASSASLHASQPPVVAVSAIAAVLVLLAVHAIAVGHALAVHTVAA